MERKSRYISGVPQCIAGGTYGWVRGAGPGKAGAMPDQSSDDDLAGRFRAHPQANG